MRIITLAAVLFVAGETAFGQAIVDFRNRVVASPLLFAPIYGVNLAAPDLRLIGNAITNGGTVDYTGCPLLQGMNFTASLWAAPDENGLVAPEFQMLATATFRTSAAVAGIWSLSSPAPVVVPFLSDGGTPILLQVRVWENRQGTINNWAGVLADPTVPRGFSEVFGYVPNFVPSPPPPMYGLTSFNLFVVPEPSLLALAGLGAVFWCAIWRRRSRAGAVPERISANQR